MSSPNLISQKLYIRLDWDIAEPIIWACDLFMHHTLFETMTRSFALWSTLDSTQIRVRRRTSVFNLCVGNWWRKNYMKWLIDGWMLYIPWSSLLYGTGSKFRLGSLQLSMVFSSILINTGIAWVQASDAYRRLIIWTLLLMIILNLFPAVTDKCLISGKRQSHDPPNPNTPHSQNFTPLIIHIHPPHHPLHHFDSNSLSLTTILSKLFPPFPPKMKPNLLFQTLYKQKICYEINTLTYPLH